MNTKHLISLYLILICSITVFGTPLRHFPNNRSAFMKQLKAYITATNKKEAVAAFNHFEQQVSSGVYTESELSQIIHLSNDMVDRKFAADPYFSDFLKSVTALKEKPTNHFLFDSWHRTLGELLQSSNAELVNPFREMLTFSILYFEKGLLSTPGAGINWAADSAPKVFANIEGAPCLVFEKTDLICFKRNKEMRIGGTQGVYFPAENRWKGKGGMITWTRVSMPEVYCEFDAYDIPLAKGVYKIQKAWLSYPVYFKGEKVEGTFEDKLSAQEYKKNGTYPIFESTNKQLNIPFSGSDLRFKGGILLKGSTVYGIGSDSSKAFFRGYGADKVHYFEARADRFLMDQNTRIAGEEVSTTIFFGQDSLFHPSVSFKFLLSENKLSLQRSNRGSNSNPFFNSYTQMNIDSKRLDWELSTNEVIINEKKATLGNTNKRVAFESAHYFDIQDYRKLQSAASVHPLAILKSLFDKEEKQFISAIKYAQAINTRFDVSTINSLIYDLVAKGYILYDKEKQEIEVLDKVSHYCDASQHKIDYDILKVISKSDKTNGRLLLDEQKIIASDVTMVEFSDRQKVAARPYKGQMTFGNNRSMTFDGKLFAGLATFQGKDFDFDYDPFQLRLDSVEYYDLFVWTGKKGTDGVPEAFSIGSRIENTSGVLLIDAPFNKSGREDISTFPAFKTKSSAYVYYDFDETLGACYSRDSFYFELHPFTLNGLDQFSADAFHFKGQMVSAGIFPEFEETLFLQGKDYSLGFIHQVPKAGYPAYGKGHFTGDIDLSNEGLSAKGTIQYMWATIESEDMIFKPHQMTATANSFALTEDLNNNIPNIAGENIQINWRPQKDSMYIKALDKPFQLYQSGDHTLMDMLILTPDGLKGRGVFDWELGKMDSKLISLGSHTVAADTCDLQVKVKGFDDLALHTGNVVSEIDFTKNMAYVKANSDTITTDFPFNEYRSTMNAFNWDFEKEQITFLSGTGNTGSFLALGKKADSLHFEGQSAQLDLITNELRIGGVPQIEVADATIFPNEGKVMILPGGKMSLLENARIVANTKNEYHVFNKSNITVTSRNSFTANGFYEYPVGNKMQEIKFDNIAASSSKKIKKGERGITMANTTVNLLYIDEHLKFSGDISLNADQDNLYFDGFAQMDWAGGESDWFKLTDRADKQNLHISFEEELLNRRGDRLFTGLFLDRYDGKVYPALMNTLHTKADQPIFTCTGLMDYKPVGKEYFFGDSLRVVSEQKQGQMLRLSENGTTIAEGLFNIGPDHSLAEAKVVGRTSISKDQQEPVAFDFMAGVNLYLPEKLLQIIYNAYNEHSFELRPMTYKSTDFYEMALTNWIPDEQVTKTTLTELNLYNELRIPQQYNDFTFVFSNLPMVWSEVTQSFVSAKDKLGLNSINKAVFNKEVEAYIEFRKFADEEDGLSLYLAAPNGQFYFLTYQNAIVSTCSNDEAYMAILDGMSDKERIKKVKAEETYEIQGVTESHAKRFVSRVKEGRQ